LCVSLGRHALIFAAVGFLFFGTFDSVFLEALQIFRLVFFFFPGGLLFVRQLKPHGRCLSLFNGVFLLEKSKLAEKLLDSMGDAIWYLGGGLGHFVILVGMLCREYWYLVGATVVTRAWFRLPTMLAGGLWSSVSGRHHFAAPVHLGPNSFARLLRWFYWPMWCPMAFQKGAVGMGNFFHLKPFLWRLVWLARWFLDWSLLLSTFYTSSLWRGTTSRRRRCHVKNYAMALRKPLAIQIIKGLLPPLVLYFAVCYGSILSGIWPTPTEAAGVGALGAASLLRGEAANLVFQPLKEPFAFFDHESDLHGVHDPSSVRRFSPWYSRGLVGEELISRLLLSTSWRCCRRYDCGYVANVFPWLILDFIEIYLRG